MTTPSPSPRLVEAAASSRTEELAEFFDDVADRLLEDQMEFEPFSVAHAAYEIAQVYRSKARNLRNVVSKGCAE